ncbi:UNVERIFIED_CONTAM: protein HEADING DATE REPRESSOR 1 [Sesamum calycinum]|uniref:Protein HEADING DATE REPRESSOR 1 n=1 Tax=Sesamum calycinum TaxID=2727403 RepID=A0AAW2SXT9_9LAMI
MFTVFREYMLRPKNANEAVDGSTVDDKTPENRRIICGRQAAKSQKLSVLSEKRKALFEPLEPVSNTMGNVFGRIIASPQTLSPQVIQKDREIDGLNEQLEEDARCLEHLQLQLLEERSKRADVERQNAMLQNQIAMLMDVLQANEAVEEEGTEGTRLIFLFLFLYALFFCIFLVS